MGRDDKPARNHMVRLYVGDEGLGPHLDPETTKCLTGVGTERSRIARKQLPSTFEEHDRRGPRIDPSKIPPERILPDLGEGPRDFHSRRAAPHDDKGEKGAPFLDLRLPFGRFEGEEHSPPDFLSVIGGLDAGRKALPVLMPEV